jgi:hypothetical protein
MSSLPSRVFAVSIYDQEANVLHLTKETAPTQLTAVRTALAALFVEGIEHFISFRDLQADVLLTQGLVVECVSLCDD